MDNGCIWKVRSSHRAFGTNPVVIFIYVFNFYIPHICQCFVQKRWRKHNDETCMLEGVYNLQNICGHQPALGHCAPVESMRRPVRRMMCGWYKCMLHFGQLFEAVLFQGWYGWRMYPRLSKRLNPIPSAASGRSMMYPRNSY